MKVSELLTDESKWTKKALARNASGIKVRPTHPTAVSWCLIGAIIKCYPTEWQGAISLRIADIVQLCPVNWNDVEKRTFSEVIELIKLLDL